MDFVWYLVAGLIGIVFGLLIGRKIFRPIKAGKIVIVVDSVDKEYYMKADMDISPTELAAMKKVLFEVTIDEQN